MALFMQLRKVCNHPWLFSSAETPTPDHLLESRYEQRSRKKKQRIAREAAAAAAASSSSKAKEEVEEKEEEHIETEEEFQARYHSVRVLLCCMWAKGMPPLTRGALCRTW